MRYFIILLFFCIKLSTVAGVLQNTPTKTIKEVPDGIIVTYTFDNPEIVESTDYPNTKYISYDGFGLNDNDGEPCVPFRNDLFIVPNNCSVSVCVLDSAYTDTTFVLSPSMPIQTDNISSVSKHSITPYSGFFPKATIYSNGVFHNRKDALINVSITPVKYNFQTNTVRRYSYIKYKIIYSSSIHEYNGDKSSAVRKVCQNSPSRAKNIDSTIRKDKHYLIVTTTEYQNCLDDFVRWKRLKGNNVHVASRPKGAWTVSAVVDTVQNYYTRDSIYYLLIVGDIDDVPAKEFENAPAHEDPIAITDFQYGLPVNEIAQIKRGRIPVNNTTELATILNKIIRYEQTPVIDENFYNKSLHCARFEDDNNDGYEDRCFTLCAEELHQYMENNFDKDVTRVYACSPYITPTHWNRYTYSTGAAIPSYLTRENYNWYGLKNDIRDIVEDGVFYVLYRGHGWERSWSSPSFPPFPETDVSFHNGEKLPFFFNLTCWNGRYNLNSQRDCMAEQIIKLQDGGGVGVIAAAGVSYSGYNDAFAYGIFDAVWPGFSPTYGLNGYSNTSFTNPTYEVGEIMDLGLLRMSETWGAARDRAGTRMKTKQLYHCFCDPSMMLYTENPSYFNSPSIFIKNDTLNVNVLEDDCRINIVNNITNEVQSYLGGNLSLYVGNQDVTVCIDKHNYVPYIWCKDLYIQNEDFVSKSKEYHAQNVKIGRDVTNQKPQGNVNVINSNILINANNMTLDKGTFINVGSSFKFQNSSY